LICESRGEIVSPVKPASNLLALALGVATACSKPASTPAPEAPVAVAPAPVAPAPRASGSQAALPARSTDPVPPSAPGEEPSLAELNRALNAYTIGMLKEPASLEDLVKGGYIKKLPAPPPGKKFVLNARKSAVLVVDR
jgi:hypothetical protein